MSIAVYAPGLTVEVRDKAVTIPVPPDPVPVPAPSIGLTDPAITDAPGGLTAGFVYGPAAANQPAIATLLPWIGQDNTPVASAKVGTGYVGAITFDLTAICRKYSPVQIGIQGVGATSLIVSGSTQAPAPAPVPSPPKLAVLYDDGSKEILILDAEVEANKSTGYMLVKQSTLAISNTSGPWLRFSAPKRDVKSATLTLTTMPKVYTGGTVNVVKFTAGYLPQPGTLPVWGGKLEIQSECWEDLPYITERIIQPAYDQYGQRKFVDVPGGRALELWLDPRQSNILDLKVGIWPEAFEAWYSYDIQVVPGSLAALIENGKLPGFSTATRPDDAYVVSHYKLPFPEGTVGTLLAGNGGGMVHGTDGHSDRGDWLAPRLPPHPFAGKLPLSSYVYNPNFVDYNGEQIPWGDYGTGSLIEGPWYTLEHRIRMNTVPAVGKGNNDGEIESRVNGKLALLRKGMRFRDAAPYDLTTLYGIQTQLMVRNFWLSYYHGGRAFPLARVPFLRCRNFKIYRIS